MTQLVELRNYFKSNDALTQGAAHSQLGIGRLSERIRELEREGYFFHHNRIKVKTRRGFSHVTEYVIVRKK